MQEAFAIAVERWRRDGIPTNPGAWIVTTARNKPRTKKFRIASMSTVILDINCPVSDWSW